MMKNCVVSLCLLLITLVLNTNSTIIGSSVVTSVSVVLGNEETQTVPSVSTTSQNATNTPNTLAIAMHNNFNPPDPGVLSVIATLKNIVEEEHQKQKNEPVQQETVSTSTESSSEEQNNVSSSTPSSVDTFLDLDDDEADAEKTTKMTSIKPPMQFTTTQMTITTSTPPEVDPTNNDTDTSAEVHQAIHRISGALLNPNKVTESPIENILVDVLTSIQSQRNATPSTTTEKVLDSTMQPPQVPNSTEPQIGFVVVGSNGNVQFGNPSEESSFERETEEDLNIISSTTTKKPLKTKPTTNPTDHPFPQPDKSNTTLKRPVEFYDDEIFGYDPYQTFLHGVYVPQYATEDPAKMAPLEDVPHHYHVANWKAQTPTPAPHPPRPTNLNASNKVKGKPVPTLPDHLHRPRPSHLQYQHAAADTIDSETGLKTVKVPHPGQKFTNHKQNLEADRLGNIGLPSNVPHGGATPQQRPFSTFHRLPASNRHTPPTFPPTLSPVQKPQILIHSPFPVKVDHGPPSGSHVVTDRPVADHSMSPPISSGDRRPLFSKPPPGNPGLEGTITNLDKEMKGFVNICNRLGLRLFNGVTNPVSRATDDKNVVLSTFTVISSLGLLFLGARGSTASQLDSLLNLDDQMTFNPHLVYHNISQSFLSQSNTAAAIIRLLVADKNKGDVLDFFKMRIQHFYDARVEEVDYKYAGHLATSIINQMIRAQIQRHAYEMLNGSLPLTGPLTLLTAAFFDGQFGGFRQHTPESLEFIHTNGQGRQPVAVPAFALRGAFRAAYEETLDVTAVDLPYNTRDLSLILLLPGRGNSVPVDGLATLKSKLSIDTWTTLMRSFMMRDNFKVIVPRFCHHSVLNLTQLVQRFGLTDMFRPEVAKFKGINGLSDLYLDQNLLHFAELSTFEKLSDTLTETVDKKMDVTKIMRPHVRGEQLSINDWIFLSRTPANAPLPRGQPENKHRNTPSLPPLTYTRIRSGKHGVVAEPLPLEEKVIRFDRPFLYVLRHNPTGFILFMGQYMEPTIHMR